MKDQAKIDRALDAQSALVRRVAVWATSVLSWVHLVLALLFGLAPLFWLQVVVVVVPACSWVLELWLWRREGRLDWLHHVLCLVGLLLCWRAAQLPYVALLLCDAATVLSDQALLLHPRLALLVFAAVRLLAYPAVCVAALLAASSSTTSPLLLQTVWLVWLLFSTVGHLRVFAARWNHL